MICNFWLGSSNDHRKIHSVRWSKVCTQKKNGGMGFRDLRAFNEALLAKQGWRLITNPNSLVAQILKAKTHPDTLTWDGTQDGNYTMKSGYHAIMHWNNQSNNATSSNNSKEIWKVLWDLKEKILPSQEISTIALNQLYEYQTHGDVKIQNPRAMTNSGSNDNCWSPPLRGTLKINVDGHLSGDGHWFTRMVIIEMNSQLLVNAVKGKTLIRKNWGCVVRRCIKLLEDNPNIDIRWVKRSTNRVAHDMANCAEIDSNREGYTIRGAYQLLTVQYTVTLDVAACLIWHSQVPLKVSISAWRLLRDSTFGGLWSLVSSRIGSSLVTAQTLPDHFVQFTISAGGLRARRSFMQLGLLACELCGMNAITDCFVAQQTHYIIRWTRSRLFPIGD
ncbi:ribonuclease H [Trifolium pratense]|uniref:Ribonuclease H n=1 Tax=Trifolium pratense TaxID=57577 RepID=A0A2K3MPX5_TRIPR|nr:ribonuclease H [Trifolium pratense]